VQRRDAEAAVAADDRRDAVHVRRRGERIPEQLRVVVRVRIDEAGTHNETARVERDLCILDEHARGNDRNDASVAHADVAGIARRSRAVDDGRPDDAMVEHADPSPVMRAHDAAPSTTVRRIAHSLNAEALPW
jgi:hypothetical protein